MLDWDEFQVLAAEMATCLRDLGCDLKLLKAEWLEVPSFSSSRIHFRGRAHGALHAMGWIVGLAGSKQT